MNARIRRWRSSARNILALAYKEAMLLRRSPLVLGTVLGQPLIFLFLFGHVLSSKPANVPWGVLDRSQGATSRRLVAEVQASGYFLAHHDVASYEDGIAALRRGDILALLVLPPDLERDALRGRPEAQLLLDGADPISAARVGVAISAIAAATATGPRGDGDVAKGPSSIELRERFWFNPTLHDRDFLLISLAGMLLTNFCLSLGSLGLTAEREEGTWEQTLALPVTVVELVLGKVAPAVVICYALLGLSIVGPGLAFGLWPRGSVLALAVLTLPYVLASLGLAVFISTIARTVAQGVFITVFAIMPSFVLSGVMMPYQLMPTVPRWIGALSPLRWYQIGSRRIYSRGGGLADVWVPMVVLSAMFLFFLWLTSRRTRSRLD